MYCAKCGQEIPGGVAECPKCDAQAATSPVVNAYAKPRKSKVAYVILGVFLGTLGIHDFYAGYTTPGLIKLLITVISCGFLSLIPWVWAIVDICTVTMDSDGQPFE